MAVGAKALVIYACFVADSAPANTSGPLVSSVGEQQQQQQQRQSQQQEVVGVVEKDRRGDSRLHGSTSVSRTIIDIFHPQDPAQAAAAAAAATAAGGAVLDGVETAGLRNRNAGEGEATVTSAAREDEPSGNLAARGARRVPDIIKHGVHNDDRNDTTHTDTTQVPEKGGAAERVAVIAACIGAVVFFLLGWCWLSSLVVCVSWCVCNCANPRLGEGSSSGDNGAKNVDGYANAVRATFCGNLASVVCVSDEAAATASQSCTPQPGSENIVQGSMIVSSNDGDPKYAASAAPAADDAAHGTGSNQSAFSAIFRRYLTATAVPSATPASAAADHDMSLELCPHHPQQETGSGGNTSGIFTAFCSTATDGGETSGGVAAGSLSWDEEEKWSESAAVVAAPQSASRRGVLGLFRNGSGSSEANGARGGLERTGSPQTSWRARLWAILRSVVGGAGRSNLAGSVQDAAAGVPSDTGSVVLRSSEERFQVDTDRWGALMASVAGSLQMDEGEDCPTVETISHRRRNARRLAGSRGRGCGGESRASSPPAVRDDGRSNGRGGAGVPTGVAGSDSRFGNHSDRAAMGRLWVPEAVAAGAAVGAVAAVNVPGGRSCSGRDGEAGDTRQEAGGTVARRTAGRSLAGGGGVVESTTACAEFSVGSAVAAAAASKNLVVPSASQHNLNLRGKGCAGAGNDGEEGRADLEVGMGEDCVSRGGETESKSPVLPRARILWRAFSEVDHDAITENHRLAGLRHLARFAPAPGIENPPMCYVPPQG